GLTLMGSLKRRSSFFGGAAEVTATSSGTREQSSRRDRIGGPRRRAGGMRSAYRFEAGGGNENILAPFGFAFARAQATGSTQRLHLHYGHVVGTQVVAVLADADQVDVLVLVGLQRVPRHGDGVDDRHTLAVLEDVQGAQAIVATSTPQPAGPAVDPVGRTV